MSVVSMSEDQVQNVDWSRFTIDFTVEGSKATNALKLSELDLDILLKLLNMKTSEGAVTDGSQNLQNLKDIFTSMKRHMVRRRG